MNVLEVDLSRKNQGAASGSIAHDRWRRYRNLAVFAALVTVTACLLVQVLLNATQLWPIDAFNYWAAWHGPMYREGARLFLNGYIYSPAFAIPLWPLAQLSWPAFAIVWSTLALAAYAWLLRPVPLAFRLPLLVACLLPISAGNVEWLLAVVLVAGGPAGWAVAALTKITPAVVGPVWYAARREWRSTVISISVPTAIAALSFILTPDLWSRWVAVLVDSVRMSPTGGALMPPLAARVPAAALVTIWAARTNRRWFLPIAMTVTQPDPTWTTLGLLAAIPRLTGPAWRQDPIVRGLRIVAPLVLAGGTIVAMILIAEKFPTLDLARLRWF